MIQSLIILIEKCFSQNTRLSIRQETFSMFINYLQITPARPRELSRLQKHQRTVTRAYGGCLSANAVKVYFKVISIKRC